MKKIVMHMQIGVEVFVQDGRVEHLDMMDESRGVDWGKEFINTVGLDLTDPEVNSCEVEIFDKDTGQQC